MKYSFMQNNLLSVVGRYNGSFVLGYMKVKLKIGN